jgi:Uma2 family endonuclease
MSEPAAPQPVLADVDDFLAWVQGQRERYEFVGGRLVMRAGGSEDHNDIQVNLLAALKRRLRGGPCKPNGSDLLVRIDEPLRPDRPGRRPHRSVYPRLALRGARRARGGARTRRVRDRAAARRDLRRSVFPGAGRGSQPTSSTG